MTSADRAGFLHRWSRRKTEAREGVSRDEDRLSQETSTELDVAAGGMPSAQQSGQTDESPLKERQAERQADALQPAPGRIERASVPPADPSAQADPPPLTLEDVQALTKESDFAPFVSRQVAPDVKNAALKKLFSDPHYNVMDRLDTYIDDYSNMEPLPAPMLRRMVSAHALNMFDSAEDGNGVLPTEGATIEASESQVELPAGAEQAAPGDDAGTVDARSVAAPTPASDLSEPAADDTPPIPPR